MRQTISSWTGLRRCPGLSLRGTAHKSARTVETCVGLDLVADLDATQDAGRDRSQLTELLRLKVDDAATGIRAPVVDDASGGVAATAEVQHGAGGSGAVGAAVGGAHSGEGDWAAGLGVVRGRSRLVAAGATAARSCDAAGRCDEQDGCRCE